MSEERETVFEKEKLMEDLCYLHENIEKVNEIWSIEDTYIKRGNLIKRLIRKLTYWLYKPMWDQQVEFNCKVAAGLADIYRMQSQLLPCTIDLSEVKLLSYSAESMLPSSDRPRIIQLVSTLNYGDAVGNEVIALKKAFAEAGYVTAIFAETIHKKIPPRTAFPYRFLPELKENDIVIYHMSSQCGIFERVKKLKARIVLRYHNITPPEFFHGYNSNAEQATKNGLRQVKELKDYVDYCIPVSEFNKQDLIKMGYTCEMEVIPILIRFEDYEQEPNPEIIERYSDGRKNLLFVGRVAPNKKFEDVISCFDYYKRHYDETARLFLVGSYREDDKYYKMLQSHIKKLRTKDVIFSGHIPFADILAYYKVADLFLCMSEHEGFCVPLVEAMYFGVPIVAYGSSAVRDTLGDAGILIMNKDMDIVAKKIDYALHNKKKFIYSDINMGKDIINKYFKILTEIL